MPPLGFDKKITVDFYNFEENSRRHPYVSTCGLYFFLPRGFEDPEEFSKFMVKHSWSVMDLESFNCHYPLQQKLALVQCHYYNMS